MSDGQQYWYSFQAELVESGQSWSGQFGYINWQGTTYVGTGALVFKNGQWVDPTGFFPVLEVGQFGKDGTQIIITTNNILSLAFKTAIDFTQPLPLDQFSASDSSFTEIIQGNPITADSGQVSKLTAIPPPPPPAGDDNPPAQS